VQHALVIDPLVDREGGLDQRQHQDDNEKKRQERSLHDPSSVDVRLFEMLRSRTPLMPSVAF
jgi:hypothetical protein